MHPQDNSTIAALVLNYVSPPPRHAHSRCLSQGSTRALSAPHLSFKWRNLRGDGPAADTGQPPLVELPFALKMKSARSAN